MTTKNTSHKILSTSLKIILFAVLVGLIYWQVKNKSAEFNVIEQFKQSFTWQRFPFLIIALLLMPINIFLESKKWHIFVNEINPKYELIDAVRSMLCGSFFGFISPNRVGEFIGRLKGIDKQDRSRSLTAGYWGGLAQFIVTFSIGIYMGGQIIMKQFDLSSLDRFTVPFVILFILTISWTYFNLKKVLKMVSKFPLINRLTDKYPIEYQMPKTKLLFVLLITLFRYLVYVNQYIYLLYFFGVELSYENLFTAVSTMLIVHTLFPSVPFVDLGVKGNALVLILKKYTFNELGILLAVFAIWVINIIIPAITGYYYALLSKKKIKKEIENAN